MIRFNPIVKQDKHDMGALFAQDKCPLAYAWMRSGRALYVGYVSGDLDGALNQSKVINKREPFQFGVDCIHVYLAEDPYKAHEMRRRLIIALRPQYNVLALIRNKVINNMEELSNHHRGHGGTHNDALRDRAILLQHNPPVRRNSKKEKTRQDFLTSMEKWRILGSKRPNRKKQSPVRDE